MDPTLTSEGNYIMREKHQSNATRVLHGLIRCIHQCLPDWSISAGGWTFGYNGSRVGSSYYTMSVSTTGCTLSLYLATKVCHTKEGYSRTAYQIITLKGNAGICRTS